MTCFDEEVLAAYVDANCDAQTRERIESHIDRCAGCFETVVEFLRMFRTTPSAGQASGLDPGAFRRGGTFGRYTLLDVAGAGGTAIVYAAHDPKLERRVALKVTRLPEADPQAGARILWEARTLARLSHRNIVVVHDAGEWNGYAYMAMEFVEGQSLSRSARSRTRRSSVSLYRDAGSGLVAAHHAELVHGDFKPDNVMVTSGGRVVVVDFGFARCTPAVLKGRCVSGGTPRFMAPELVDGASPTIRSDVYAFAVALWTALTGRFPGKPDDGETRVPWSLRKPLRWALERDPAQRPATLRPLLHALDRYLNRRTKWIRAGLASAVVSGLAAALAMPATPRCPGTAAAQDELWSDADRVQLDTTLSEQHADQLRDYAAAWGSLRTESCSDTWERGFTSPPQLEVINACLARNRVRFDAVVDTLTNASAAQLTGAGEAVEGLFTNESCRSPDLSSPALPPAPTEAQGEAVARLRSALERAHALRIVGPIPEAIQSARGVVVAAVALGYGPMLAEAQIELSAALNALPDPQGAEVAAQEGLVIAERHGMPQARFEGWMQKILAVAKQGHYDAALHLAKAPEVALEALPDPREGRARLALFLGQLHGHRDEPQTACGFLERALRQLEEMHGPDDPVLISALVALADCSQALVRLDESRAHAERALAIGRAQLSPDDRRLAGPLEALVGLDIRQFAFQRARERALEILQLLEKTYGAHSPRLYSVLVNAARASMFAGHVDEALALVDRSVLVAEHGDPRDSVRSLRQAAFIRLEAARVLEPAGAAIRLAQAQSLLDRAEARVHLLDRPRLEQSQIFEHRGLVLSGQRRWAQAAEQLTASLELLGPDNGAETGPKYLARGAAYSELLMWEEAIADFIAARDGTLGDKDPRFRAIAQRNLGLAYLGAGRTQDAVSIARVVARAYETYPGLESEAPLDGLAALATRG